MSYQDPYGPNQDEGNDQNQGSYNGSGQGQGDYGVSGDQGQGSYDGSGQTQGDYGMGGMSQNLWQQSQNWGQQDYENQWTYGDPGHKLHRSNTKAIDTKYGYSDYQYPPSYPNREKSLKSALSKKGKPSVEVVPVRGVSEVLTGVGANNRGLEKGEFKR